VLLLLIISSSISVITRHSWVIVHGFHDNDELAHFCHQLLKFGQKRGDSYLSFFVHHLSDDGFERIHYESKLPVAELMELFHLVVMHGLIFSQLKCGTKLEASIFCCW